MEKIFIIDGPLLIACFSSQIRIYPLDIEGNYLQYHIPTGWKVGTVSTIAVCQIHLCIIEWSSAIIPTFWTIVPISNYLNRFSEKIESLAFPNSTNLSDGLWAAFFSSNPIPSTVIMISISFYMIVCSSHFSHPLLYHRCSLETFCLPRVFHRAISHRPLASR